jgi:hypothetical protein
VNPSVVDSDVLDSRAGLSSINDRTAAYRWNALPEDILAKVRCAREVLDKTQQRQALL